MTREEQIEKEARLVSYNGDEFTSFIQGAEWADKTMIEKACRWLEENIDAYSKVVIVENSIPTIVLTEDFKTNFKKAMED